MVAGNMTPQAQLLAEIETFLATRKMAETTFGLHAANDGKLVGRLRDGANIMVSTIDRVRAYMRAEAARNVKDGKVGHRSEAVNGA